MKVKIFYASISTIVNVSHHTGFKLGLLGKREARILPPCQLLTQAAAVHLEVYFVDILLPIF